MANRILPEFWRYDPAVSSLRVHTRELLFRLVLAMDDYWRCFVGSSPQQPDFLRSTLYPLNPEVRLADVSRSLAEAQAAGVLLVRDSERGWYVEVAETFRYRREDYEEAQPKFGPRIPRKPAQSELPLGPVALPPAKKPSKKAFREPRPLQANRIRIEDGDETESSGTPPEVEPQGNRMLSQGSDSGNRSESKFSRDVNAFPGDAAWAELTRLLCFEMVDKGALWEGRWRENRDACVAGLRDWQAKSPQQRAEGGNNPGAFITKAFTAATQRLAS